MINMQCDNEHWKPFIIITNNKIDRTYIKQSKW